MLMRKLAVAVVLVLAIGCDTGPGGDDSGQAGDQGGADEGAPADVLVEQDTGRDLGGPGDTAEPDAAAQDSVVVDVGGDDVAVADTGNEVFTTGLYADEPDAAHCVAGAASDYQKQIVLDRVNYIRSLHGLYPVDYNPEFDGLTAECALIIAANRKLSHTPGTDWKCWSQDAYDGCNTSNIYVQWGRDRDDFSSLSVVDSFMTDEGVDSLGHRRWLVDPWLAYISFGRVDTGIPGNNTTGAAIRVINDEMQSVGGSGLEFVAYPFESYPAELYNDDVMMSLTVIGSTVSKWSDANRAGFSGAIVTVTGPGGSDIPVSNILYDDDGYGVPNNIRWFATGVEPGVRYDVGVAGVDVDGSSRDYSWWFELD